MSDFVLDCSATMGWCFEDQADQTTARALRELEQAKAFVPHLWMLEVLNVLVTAERRTKIRHSESARFLELLRALPITAEEPEPSWNRAEGLVALARQYALSSYDASYLSLAMRLGLPLATRDGPLRAAARAASVPLLD